MILVCLEGDMTRKYRAVDFPAPGPTWQKITGPIAQLRKALEHTIENQENGWKIVDASSVMSKVLELDNKIMHVDRSQFLHAFFEVAGGKAVVAEDGSVLAVGSILPTYTEATQVRVGPLYAENFNCVLVLLNALMRDVEQPDFYLASPAETENGKLFINFLIEKADASLGPLLERSYSRPYDLPTQWNNVFALSCHIASPLS